MMPGLLTQGDTMNMATLTGTLHYLTLEALPTVTLQVSLWKDAPADAASTLLASTTRRIAPNSPLTYTLEYDPAELCEGETYSLTARLYCMGRLYKITDTYHPVALAETAHMDIPLTSVHQLPREDANQDKGIHGGPLIDLECSADVVDHSPETLG
jgi:uncharacterized lipoprotein YbaY